MDSPLYASLPNLGILSVTGEDARAFLHAQLSNDIEHLPADRARLAGYCSAKGRLLAEFVVVPVAEGFLLQVSRDLVPGMVKRLGMFVLRAKVKITEAGERYMPYGVWGANAADTLKALKLPSPATPFQVATEGEVAVVAMAADRFLVLGDAGLGERLKTRCAAGDAEQWRLAEVRAGWPRISLATQDAFVPQMTNLELIGGVDFKKGCYPGQEIVARTQYLGKLKRRMYRGEVDGTDVPVAGQDVFIGETGNELQAIGTVVSAAPRPGGGYELLAVLQTSAIDQGASVRLGSPDGPQLRILSLPYPLPVA